MKTKRAKKKSQTDDAIQKILSFGTIDFTIKIPLTSEDLANAKIEFEKIITLQDLKFINEDQNIMNRMTLTTDNTTLNTLLFMNKSSKKKAYIDFIPFTLPTYNDQDTFGQEILKFVTESYYLCINETQLMEGGRYYCEFIVLFDDQTKCITLGTPKKEAEKLKEEEKEEKRKKRQGSYEEPMEKDKKAKENPEDQDQDLTNKQPEETNIEPKQEQTGEQPQEKEENKDNNAKQSRNHNTNEEKDTQKTSNTPDIRNKNSPLAKMITKCSAYDLFYIELKDIIANIPLEDFFDLLLHLKTRITPTLIAIAFPNLNPYLTTMDPLNRIMLLTDIFFFNFKEATQSFDTHYRYFTYDNPLKEIDDRKTFDYFISGIARSGGKVVIGTKIGVFLDDFIKLTIVEASKSMGDKVSYDCQPYQKVNHANIKLVEKYKDAIKTNFDFLYAIFIGGFLNKLVSTNRSIKGQELLYPSFLTGLEIVKRAVELFKNDLPMSDNVDFFNVKLSQSKIEEDLKKYYLGTREGGFVLDCTNQEKASMKDYMPLYDYHLHSFFSSGIIRKDLKNKGFINSEGYIMYDPVYRSVMGAQCKNMPPEQSQKEMNEKLMQVIQAISVGQDLRAKDIDSQKKVLRAKSPTSNKIPLYYSSNEYKGKKRSSSNHHCSSQKDYNKILDDKKTEKGSVSLK